MRFIKEAKTSFTQLLKYFSDKEDLICWEGTDMGI